MVEVNNNELQININTKRRNTKINNNLSLHGEFKDQSLNVSKEDMTP